MLSMSDTSIESVLPFFTSKGVDVAFLVPTPTGYQKAIMDATIPFRQFLKRNHIHDFDRQGQGQMNKIEIPTYLVLEDGFLRTRTSLYRPETKQGDPRVWVQGAKHYISPANLLGIITDGHFLYVLNLSSPSIRRSLANGVAYELLESIERSQNTVADELLRKILSIYRTGFIKSVNHGDTSVGMTLEHALGIPPNSSKKPDYKGIEIKAARGVRFPNRVNLFSQVPDWANSNIKTAQELLDTYGYVRSGRTQLYCTVEAHVANSQGLYFDIDEENDKLLNRHKSVLGYDEVVQWDMKQLRDRLAEKHRETFWVKAESRFVDGREEFLYNTIVHTKKPNINQLGVLIDENIITMDYTLSQLGRRVRDHGYLFKIKPENVPMLFPKPKHYQLQFM